MRKSHIIILSTMTHTLRPAKWIQDSNCGDSWKTFFMPSSSQISTVKSLSLVLLSSSDKLQMVATRSNDLEDELTRLSMTTTEYFCGEFKRHVIVCVPMYPHPPVTRMQGGGEEAELAASWAVALVVVDDIFSLDLDGVWYRVRSIYELYCFLFCI